MKKKYLKMFKEYMLLEQSNSIIVGGQDPGYDTSTSDCTHWYAPDVGVLPDTDRDGDWVDACC